MEKLIQIFYLCKSYYRIFLKKLKLYKGLPRKLAGKEILPSRDGSDYLKSMIQSGKPFAAVRFGSTELSVVSDALSVKAGRIKHIREKSAFSFCRNAGFFPDDKDLMMKYGEMVAEYTKDVDLFGVWNLRFEDYMIRRYSSKTAKLCQPRGLESYYPDNVTWTKELKGKKVLVIHPFENSIRNQYRSNREKLFQDPDVLPEFELLTVKAVQSIAYTETGYKDWYEAFDNMYNTAMEMDWDVALIGCGAYGFPLAVRFKQAGRQAIQLGGCTQILFGIKGKRWDHHPVISELYNEYWIRPSEEEIPIRSKEIEGGCYW